MKTPTLSQGGASEYIRAAERSIAAGDLNLALQQIANARSIDPQNEYLDAIIERIDLLASRRAPVGKSGFLQVPPVPVPEPGRHQITPELQARVKRLTNVAINLFERGSYETAFDSLMKAYLLDPSSTYVMNCEKTLLPAIELMRKRGTIASPGTARAAAQQSPSQHAAGHESAGNEESRLETLRHQKDLERQEKERAMWRDASKPFDPTVKKVEPPKNEPPNSGTSSRQGGGFFTKLRGGKLLG
jgi:tetratricopeptide (TPR) repeat protein